MFVPLFVLLFIFVTAIRRPVQYWSTFCLSLVCIFVFQQMLDPSYDSDRFIGVANGLTTFYEVFVSEGSPGNAFASVHWVVDQITLQSLSEPVRIALVNSLYISLIMTLPFLFFNQTQFSICALAVTFLLFFYPSFTNLCVSANKDFTAAVGLIVAVLSFRFFDYDHFSQTRKIMSFLVIFLVGLWIVYVTRSYFLYFLVLAVMVGCFSYFMPATFPVKLVLNFSITVCTCAVVLVIAWDSIRRLTFTYLGRAEISWIYHATKPTFLDANFYIFKSLFSSLVAVFVTPLWTTISSAKMIAGVMDTAFVIVASLLTISISHRKQLIGLIFFSFLIIELTIQPWGSPNLGSLFRLRVPILLGLISLSGFLMDTRPWHAFLLPTRTPCPPNTTPHPKR